MPCHVTLTQLGGGGLVLKGFAGATLTHAVVSDNLALAAAAAPSSGFGGGFALSSAAGLADFPPQVCMVACEVRGNTAERGGGAAYNDGGRLELFNRTLLLNNSAPAGSSVYALAGTTVYRLPTPPGRWLPSTECVIYSIDEPSSIAWHNVA